MVWDDNTRYKTTACLLYYSISKILMCISFLQKKCNLLESPFNFLCNHNFKIKFELKYCKLHTAAFSRKQPNVILSAVHFSIHESNITLTN